MGIENDNNKKGAAINPPKGFNQEPHIRGFFCFPAICPYIPL